MEQLPKLCLSLRKFEAIFVRETLFDRQRGLSFPIQEEDGRIFHCILFRYKTLPPADLATNNIFSLSGDYCLKTRILARDASYTLFQCT